MKAQLCVCGAGGGMGEQIVISVSWIGGNERRSACTETNFRSRASASFMIVIYIVFSSHSQLIPSFCYSLDKS